jgi:hypothetical protein
LEVFARSKAHAVLQVSDLDAADGDAAVGILGVIEEDVVRFDICNSRLAM